MVPVKKQLSTLSFLFSLGFLSPGFFIYGTFSSAAQRLAPPLNGASDRTVVRSYSPLKRGGRNDLKAYSEPTPCSESVLSVKQNAEFALSNLTVVPLRSKFILVSKTPRYIFKSVLNI
jgi:hypothetical protein